MNKSYFSLMFVIITLLLSSTVFGLNNLSVGLHDHWKLDSNSNPEPQFQFMRDVGLIPENVNYFENSSCINGGCYHFKQSSGSAAALEENISRDPLTQGIGFTMGLWIRPRIDFTADTTTNLQFLDYANDYISLRYAKVGSSTSSTSCSAGELMFRLYNGATFSKICYDSDFIQDVSYNVLILYDNGTNQIRMYINGTNVQNSTSSGWIDGGVDENVIGNTITPSTSYDFDGIIDEVSIWNKILNNSEIEQYSECFINESCWEGIAPPTDSGNVDIIFYNYSNDIKTVFEQGENIKFKVNWTESISGESISNSNGECNVTAYKPTIEKYSIDQNFSLCDNVLCDYTNQYKEEFESLNGGSYRNNSVHFSACFPDLPLNNLFVNISCGGNMWENFIINNNDISRCNLGYSLHFLETEICYNKTFVNVSIAHTGIYNKRVVINGFKYDKEYEEFYFNTSYNSSTELWDYDITTEYYLEYYDIGSEQFNASCDYYLYDTYDTLYSENITILNIPPVITYGGIIVGSTLYQFINNTVINFDNLNFNFVTGFSDTNFYNGNHTIQCSNGSVLYSEIHNTTDYDEHNISYSIFTDFDCNNFTFTSLGSDIYNVKVNETIHFTVQDLITPVCLINNISILNGTNYENNIYCSDENFFNFNITCSNGYNYSVDGLNEPYIWFNNTFNSVSETITCNYEYCDGHTALELNTDVNILKDSESKEIYFNKNIYTNTLKLSSIDNPYAYLDYELKKDRMIFKIIDDTKEIKFNTYIFEYYTSENSYYFVDNKYKAWIVDGDAKTWFDLNGYDGAVTVTKAGDGIWQFRLTTDKKYIEFESIGELNCVETLQTITPYTKSEGYIDALNLKPCPTSSNEIFLNIFFLGIIILVLILNAMVIKLPVFDALIGLAFIMYSLTLYMCSFYLGILITFLGIALLIYASK